MAKICKRCNGIFEAEIESCPIDGDPLEDVLPTGPGGGAPTSAPGARVKGWMLPVIALALLILPVAGAIIWKISTGRGKAPAPPAATPVSAPDTTEVMRYYLEIESENGTTTRATGADPLPEGATFQLHILPSAGGYLYVLAQREESAPYTLLLGNETGTGGAPSNRASAGTELVFPAEPDPWIELNAETMHLTLVFAPEPLVALKFLAGPPGRELSKPERDQFEVLLSRSRRARAEIETAPATVRVSAPATGDLAAPVVVDLSLRRK